MIGINRPAQKRRIPSVLTKDEMAGLLAHMDGPAALIARLLYGTGMRLMEGICKPVSVHTPHVLKVAAGDTTSPLDVLKGLAA